MNPTLYASKNEIPGVATDVTADVQVSVTLNEAKHPVARTAIKLSHPAQASVDVVTSDGKLLCRLNIFDFGGGRGDVDVILDPATQKGRFLAWNNGVTVVDTVVDTLSTVHAVEISPR